MAYKTDTVALRKAMLDNKIMTIEGLSAKTGISRNTLSNILNGKKQPSTIVMYKLAECLGFDSSVAGDIFFAS